MVCNCNQFTASEYLNRRENISSDDESTFDILNLDNIVCPRVDIV